MKLWAVEYQLVNAAPEYVFEWLKNNVIENHQFGDDDRTSLEQSLLARNNKLINLALALYGEVPSIGYGLFNTNDPVIKQAALSGRSLRPIFLDKSWAFNNDVIPALIEDEMQQSENGAAYDGKTLLHELLNNKFIPSNLLEAAYEKSGPFSEIDEDLWIKIVAMTARNERLTTPYSSTWMDGYDEYKYNSVFSAGWGLFCEFPVNKRAASVLSYLSDRLVPYSPYKPKQVMDVIDRWRSANKDEDESYSYVRTALVKLITNNENTLKELKSHPDLALRKGYYANFHFETSSEITEGFEADGNHFLDAALYNDSIFKNEEIRNTLKRACWNAPDEYSRMDYPNYFLVRAELMMSKYPEWFKDSWSGEIPFEEIKDSEERREKRLIYLNSQVAELHKALLGEKKEHQETNEFGENNVLHDLRAALQQIGEHLGVIHQKISFSWGWIIASAALGFFIGRY